MKIILIISFFSLSMIAFSNDCKSISKEHEFETSDYVIIGVVINKSDSSYSIKTYESFKGITPDTLVVSLDDYSVFPEIGDIWLFYATKFSERTIHISKCGWSRNIENPINMNSIFFPKPLTTNTSESELLVLDAITLSNLNNELFNDITTLRNKKNQEKFNSLFLTVKSLKEQTKLILVIMIFIVISLLGIIIFLIKKR